MVLIARYIPALLAAAVLIALAPSGLHAQEPVPGLPPGAGVPTINPSLTIRPGTPAMKQLDQDTNAANIINETTSGNQLLMIAPWANNVPGGVSIPIPQSPVGVDPDAVTRGKQYFVKFNCVGCHAPNGGGGMGLSLSDSHFKFGQRPAQLYALISHGAPLGMPAWGAYLPSNVIWDLVAYIQSISKAPGPEWGRTISKPATIPPIEQVPAEFTDTTNPWQLTEPFSYGHKPTQHPPTTGAEVPPGAATPTTLAPAVR